MDKIAQHRRIEPSAAAGAALEHDVGVRLHDAVEHAVEAEHIAVGDFTLLVRGQRVGPEVRDRPVEVPLHIGDIGAVQDPVDAFDQVVLDFPASDVQHQLVAAPDRVAPGDLHSPVGVRAEEVGVLRHHLGLEPDAEFHAEVIDLPHELRQAALDLLLIDEPVAEAGIVVVALSEPAVVHDDHLDAHVFGGFRYFDQFLVVEVKKCRFPGVDQDGAPDVPHKFAPVEISAEEIVEVVAHPGDSLVGVGHEDGRRVEGLARLDGVAEEAVVDAHHEARLVVLVELGLSEEASRVHQREAVAGAKILISRVFDERDEGVLLVGGDAAPAADLVHVVGQGLALDLALLAVPSREGDQVKGAAVHVIHVDGHDALEVDAAAAVVVNARRAHDDVRFFKDGIEERHLNVGDGVLDGELQSVHGVRVCCKGGREPVQGKGTLVDLVRDVAAVEGKAAVAILHFDRIDAEIALLLGRELLRLGVEGEGALLERVVGVAREAAVVAADQVAEVLVADRGSVVKVVDIVEVADLELVGGLGSVQ